jgi:diacylglycerol O-acyltransferase
MTGLRQLTPRDVMFVGGETSNIYQHTGGLILLDASEHPDFGFDSFRRHLEERLAGVPHFRWKLHEVPLGLDLPYWVEDESFSFERHIRRIAVPSPGDRRALGEVAAYLYSRHLDRSRPLWEIWLIEGLRDRQYALFTKLHHCMMDGEGATRLGAMICDFEPDAPVQKIDPAIAEARPGRVPELWREALNAAMHLWGLPLQAAREILDAARLELSRRMPFSPKLPGRPAAPVAFFNADIGSERGFVFGSLPLDDVKAVKSHFGVTLNDVVLALVATSLRSYLLRRDELPAESLRTSIAVSLRKEDDTDLANKVTAAGVTLATDLADPAERLRAIAEESIRAKSESRLGRKGFFEIVSLLPPVLVNAVMSASPPELVPRMSGFNLLISNVRGSPLPMYVGGARASAIYPMSIIAPGAAINVTCISYLDRIEFGLTIEPKLFPDPWFLVDGLVEALEEYRKRIGPTAEAGGAVRNWGRAKDAS